MRNFKLDLKQIDFIPLLYFSKDWDLNFQMFLSEKAYLMQESLLQYMFSSISQLSTILW